MLAWEKLMNQNNNHCYNSLRDNKQAEISIKRKNNVVVVVVDTVGLMEKVPFLWYTRKLKQNSSFKLCTVFSLF